ncbi:MAG: diadenylate cyclase CdaA [Bacteroidales bacterium]|nr:diadenylate cyclase CdaA [Bacteroidales bacterium]
MLPLLSIQGLPNVRFVDILDVLLVAFLLYEFYRLAKGTNVMRIFWTIVSIYVLWRIVDVAGMRLSSEILGAFISVGLLAIVVVFQPEIRKFLLVLGTKASPELRWRMFKRIFGRRATIEEKKINLEPYIQACMHMSVTKTGALIIFKRENSIDELVATGERIDAKVSSALLETLFFKNSPLHDGAVFVDGNTVVAARCILPVTARTDVDPNLGLRHRSAIGVTEQLDVVAVVVSEETGAISYAFDGEVHHDVSPVELRQTLERLTA